MLLALLAAATVAQGAAIPDPLAPAAQGQVQCYAPDVAQKTCKSMAYYAAKGAGLYENTAIVLVSASPLILLRTVLPVTVKGDAVCGTITEDSVMASQVNSQGQALTAVEAQPLLSQLVKAMTPVIGHEICTQYVTEGDHIVAKATMDGAVQPDETLIWVSAADGYQVKP